MYKFWHKFILIAVSLCGAAGLAPTARAQEQGLPPAKPFKHAMIFSGLALDFTAYIGLYDAALESGNEPDLIIATSGGAVAAGIIAAFPDKEERKKFIESEDFYHFMSDLEVKSKRPSSFVARLPRFVPRTYGLAPLTPNLFRKPLSEAPIPSNQTEFDSPFPSGADRPKIIIIAAKLEYSKANALRIGKKLFTETWFTDQQTGEYLSGMESPVGARFSRSAVQANAEVRTEFTVAEGLLASISEPYLFVPACLNGELYTGGAVDLWPVELAHELAGDITLPKLPDLSRTIELAFGSVFEYSNKKRMREVQEMSVSKWVDMEDNREVLKDSSFWFKVEMLKQEQDGSRSYLIPRPRVVYTAPANYEAFVERIRTQYEYGYERGLGGLVQDEEMRQGFLAKRLQKLRDRND